MIYEVANVMNVDPTELLTGEEPKMNSYTVTRSGQGVSVERYKEAMHSNRLRIISSAEIRNR